MQIQVAVLPSQVFSDWPYVVILIITVIIPSVDNGIFMVEHLKSCRYPTVYFKSYVCFS